jgi:hypothetical protein
MNRRQIARSKAQFPRCAYLIFLNEGSNIIGSALDQGTRPLLSLSEKSPPKDPRCRERQCVLAKLRDLSKEAK